jgi:hypothetical protein
MIIFLSVIAPIAALVEWRKKEGAYVAAKRPERVSQGDLIESKVDVITAPGASRGATDSQILIDS